MRASNGNAGFEPNRKATDRDQTAQNDKNKTIPAQDKQEASRIQSERRGRKRESSHGRSCAVAVPCLRRYAC